LTLKIFHHPLTQKTRRIIRRGVVTCAVMLAVAFVTTLSVDLGPALKAGAETGASQYMGRPMHIGRLSAHLWRGRFVFEDVVIEGLTPDAPPFLVADRITVSMPWTSLVNQRVVFDAIEMTDWRMYSETFPDGSHNFPRFTRSGPRGPSAWTTTLQYVRAYRGEFVYTDHATPWNTIARNVDVAITRPTSEYRGQASFSDSTIVIQDYEPMRADMDTTFRVVGDKLVFDQIDLTTEGSQSLITGEVDVAHWPEQLYHIRSRMQLPEMRKIFFAHDEFSLSGESIFTGTFHLFRDVMNGRPRNGRELSGTFYSATAGINAYRFDEVRGSVVWIPERLDVTSATTSAYGGTGRFAYRMAPIGDPDVPAYATFDAVYAGVDLEAFTNFLELDGIRLAGRAEGRNLLEWPLGRYSEHRGGGYMRVTAGDGVEVLTRQLSASQLAAADARSRKWDVFSDHLPLAPVPMEADLVYTYDPEWVDFAPSRVATAETYVELEGRTAYGDRSEIDFHVTSADWQESDRVFAGSLTAFGARTGVFPVGGQGTFDGVMLNDVRSPRVEGRFAGEHMRGFDVVWGTVTGFAAIENSYADVSDTLIIDGDSTMRADGRYSLGFPRSDGGEEIDARILLTNRPLADLRHAFDLDDYDLDGSFSGEFRVYGAYLTPYGFGQMTIAPGTSYGETFETATSAVRLDGDGIRLDSLEIVKSAGRASGAAWVGLDGTYAFNLDGRGLPVETVAMVTFPSAPPLTGRLDFSAGGSGTFERPRYDVRGTISDFFVGDEGIGEVIGELNINVDVLTLKIEAASPRLAVSGAGRIALTPEMETELLFTVADTSLDPYVRELNPDVSAYATAVASGTVRVAGHLANIDELLVDATVDRLDLRLFDYVVRNASPIRVALDRHVIQLTTMQLVGDDTQLDITGTVNLHDDRMAVRAIGDAGLGILQAFVPNINSSGRASLEATFQGQISDPIVTGSMTVENGRIRHFDLPHALENLSGPVRFDSRSVRLDEVTAQLAGGPIRFGGQIDVEGYEPTRLDVTMAGENMLLRFPEGMRSLVDADLAVQGMFDEPELSGIVTVRNAVYTREFGEGPLLFDLTADDTPLDVVGPVPPPTLALRYDVQIVAPSTLEIRNSTARLFASADLQLSGTFDSPMLLGRSEVIRGEFAFEGRRYQITRGTIDFNNPTRVEPFFDIETETRVRVPGQTYRVIARAAGTMDRLVPSFEADPPLVEVEVLGLLFGDVAPGQDVEFLRYSTDVTPQQQLLRGAATRALTGTLSSQVGRVVEQAFGVDTFQLTPSLVDPNAQSSRLDPAARLTIGKRLSERIYLTYARSLSSSTGDQIILLEYDQTDQFAWILSRNEDRTYALDVRVRRAF
jgi:hypothetical protein